MLRREMIADCCSDVVLGGGLASGASSPSTAVFGEGVRETHRRAPMEAPEAPHIELCFNGVSGVWEAHHRLTTERVVLPDLPGRWVAINDDAEAVCFQNGERAIWWRELAKTHLVLDEGGGASSC